MKKILSLTLVGASAALLAACANGIPECNNNQIDGCGRGGPYTDERTAVGRPAPAPVVQQQVIVEPVPVVSETTTIVVEEPAPAPVDTSIMRQAPEPSQNK